MNKERVVKMISAVVIGIFSLGFFLPAQALVFDIPPNGDNVVGHIRYAYSLPGDTLFKIGRRFDIGYFEMIEANPRLSAEHNLGRNTRVVIPSRYILPGETRNGIVINLSELRLYYFFPDGKRVLTEPVGIGRVGWQTPTGKTKIIQKKKDPAWHPTDAVREEAASQGYILPDVWPPGPDNPLGQYMLRMGWYTYLIHGTNSPNGVGKRVSAGCIRMFPEDIEKLYYLVDVGTAVTVVDKPIKTGWQGSKLLVEVHKPLEEKGELVTSDTIDMVAKMTAQVKNKPVQLRWQQALQELKNQTGIPVEVGKVDRARLDASINS
jgi:L,D-transpeptidase ErfK/SrfK